MPHNENQTWDYFKENTVDYLIWYYDEVSYGALTLKFLTSDRNASGLWYQIGPSEDYWHNPSLYVQRAINAAASDFNFDIIDIAVVIPPTDYVIWDPVERTSVAGVAFMELVKTSSGNVWPIIISYRFWTPPPPPSWPDEKTNVWAHEIAHQLGFVIGGGALLPDLGGGAGHSGDIDFWGLMGPSAPFIHLCSWSKERLGWLRHEPVDRFDTDRSYWESWINALPTLSYGDSAYYYFADAEHELKKVPGLPAEDWYYITEYIPEVRTSNENYSSWDTMVPDTGLVLYQVDTTLVYIHEQYFRGWQEVNVIPGSPLTLGESAPVGGDLRFGVLDEDLSMDYYRLRVFGMEEQLYKKVLAVAHTVPYWVGSKLSFMSLDGSVYPDLDLHAYTLDGLHVGMNYETGEYEIEIDGAVASGDLFQGTEWIRLPDDVEAYFIMSSHDVAAFLENRLGVLENENGIYAVSFRYYDENGARFASSPIGEPIPPGAEVFVGFSITQNPDGTYSVETKPGMDLLSLDVWQAEIDNIPDDVFINQPTNRKQTLKSKFNAVFNMWDVNNYPGMVRKLTNDILEKLDADGDADWVEEPILVNPIKAFIAILNSKSG
jgi:M6 family metalloprotease-like protein